MVDGSDLAWRIISRRYGAELCYTPMINSRMYARPGVKNTPNNFRESAFNREAGEEGSYRISLQHGSGKTTQDSDRPLVAQFCGDDPERLLIAANDIADKCDAVDLNLGCPQAIAKRGHYGAFLQDEWPLVFNLIDTLHRHCKVPVTAKMRIFDDPERTVAYAQMLERAGAQIITVHGRTREMRGQAQNLADWPQIKLVKQNVQVPVIANGNVCLPQDIDDALAVTEADGVMVATAQLSNPGLLSGSLPVAHPLPEIFTPSPSHPPVVDLVREYLSVVASLQTPTSGPAIRQRLFTILYPALTIHTEFRPQLGTVPLSNMVSGPKVLEDVGPILDSLEAKLKADEKGMIQTLEIMAPNYSQLSAQGHRKWGIAQQAYLGEKMPERLPTSHYQHLVTESPSRPSYIAHWLAQPNIRHPPPETLNADTKQMQERTRALLKKTRSPASDSAPVRDTVCHQIPLCA